MTEISEHDKAVILAEADELKVTVAAYSSDSIDTLGLLAFWLEGVYAPSPCYPVPAFNRDQWRQAMTRLDEHLEQPYWEWVAQQIMQAREEILELQDPPSEMIQATPNIPPAPVKHLYEKGIKKGNKRQISLTISPELLQRVDEVALRSGQARAAVINLAIFKALEGDIFKK